VFFYLLQLNMHQDPYCF